MASFERLATKAVRFGQVSSVGSRALVLWGLSATFGQTDKQADPVLGLNFAFGQLHQLLAGVTPRSHPDDPSDQSSTCKRSEAQLVHICESCRSGLNVDSFTCSRLALYSPARESSAGS